eukprot:TRINITY_DN2363_c0_g2_i5.p1 TRINITY_DN2363_c0_g2~~TRINITY_DN2363_c0_g2_i5.p1  ORF type:complete len:410 (+),score=83.24 TRINITY_DN2363_c0_g2_i5:167-1396(+)
MDLVAELVRGTEEEVACVGVTGQMHGVVVLARDTGAVLTPLVTWQDQRCAEEPGFLARLCRATGHDLCTGFGCATLAWARAHDAMPAGAETGAVVACTVMDALVARLCGGEVVMDDANAASFGLYDGRARDWDCSAALAAGVPPALLPRVVSAGTPAGTLAPPAAARLGLRAGTPVCTATGDFQAALLASLANVDSDVALNLGTGGQVAVVLPSSTQVPAHMRESGRAYEFRPFPRHRVAVTAATLCAGAAWAWLASSARSWALALGAGSLPEEAHIYARLDTLGLAYLDDWAAGRVSQPPYFGVHLLGERHDPSMRGRIDGISLENAGPGAMAAAVARGIARALREQLPPAALEGRTRVVASGGAARRSALLRRAAAEEFGLPLHLCGVGEEAAVGAALLAEQMFGID